MLHADGLVCAAPPAASVTGCVSAAADAARTPGAPPGAFASWRHVVEPTCAASPAPTSASTSSPQRGVPVFETGAAVVAGRRRRRPPRAWPPPRAVAATGAAAAVAGMVEVGGVFDEAAADGSDADVGGWDPAISAAGNGAEEGPAGAVCSGTGGAIGFSKAMRELEAAAFAAIAAAARPGPRALTLGEARVLLARAQEARHARVGSQERRRRHGLRMPARLRPSVSHGLSSDPELRIVSKSIESRSIMGDGGTPPGACAPLPGRGRGRGVRGGARPRRARDRHARWQVDAQAPRQHRGREGLREGARPCEDEPCTRAAPRAISGGT